ATKESRRHHAGASGRGSERRAVSRGAFTTAVQRWLCASAEAYRGWRQEEGTRSRTEEAGWKAEADDRGGSPGALACGRTPDAGTERSGRPAGAGACHDDGVRARLLRGGESFRDRGGAR